MFPRLQLLRELLAEDGVIFVHIDDYEGHYLKVIMDEIFGRKNFCGVFVWEKKKKPSFLNANMGGVTEYIFAYSPNRSKSPPFIGGMTTKGKKYPFNNAGNGLQTLTFPEGAVRFNCADGIYEPQDMSEGKIVTRLLTQLVIRDGSNLTEFQLQGEWRYSQKKLDEIVHAGEAIIISKVPFRPNHIKAGGEDKKIKNLLSIAHYEMSTYEDSNAETIALFGDANAFTYPKPEKLIQTLIDAVTNPGDLVLDSFLGSGTTAAVAHKMGRKWIGIEMGDHAITHCAPRLKKVIEGEQGGISEAVGWQGGGGFRFYKLGSTVFDTEGRINPEIRFAHLAAHIWFSETHTALHKKATKPLLGIHNGTAYYLLYNGILGDKRPDGGNVLTGKVLADLATHDGPKVIYGEACRLGPARLKALGITFKQTPYDVKAR